MKFMYICNLIKLYIYILLLKSLKQLNILNCDIIHITNFTIMINNDNLTLFTILKTLYTNFELIKCDITKWIRH